MSASLKKTQTHPGRFIPSFTDCCSLFCSANRNKGSQTPCDLQREGWGCWWGVGELVEDLFIAVRFLTPVPTEGPNKSLYHYVREAGPAPSGTSGRRGTFYIITASSITTQPSPQPPTHYSLLSIPPSLSFFLPWLSPSVPRDPLCLLHRAYQTREWKRSLLLVKRACWEFLQLKLNINIM